MKQAMERLLEGLEEVIVNLREDLAEGGNGQDHGAKFGREVDADGDHDGGAINARHGVTSDTLLQVPAADLFLLVNRARKMVRLAREGKIPDQEERAPLCQTIKALKARGLTQRPVDLRL